MSGIEKQVEALVERTMRRVLAETHPIENDDRDRIAECLVRIFYLYDGHNVDSRGPAGCIVDALEILAPDIVRQVSDGAEWDDVYKLRWSEDT